MKPKHDRAVVLIGVLKLIKGTALIVIGALALLLPPKSLAGWGEHLLGSFQPGRATLDRWLVELWHLQEKKEKLLALASAAYAVVFLIEGVGLLLRKPWAEWLTVFVTASFVPIEIYELISEFGVGKLVTLVLNVAIVVYLAHRRLAERHGRRGARAHGSPHPSPASS